MLKRGIASIFGIGILVGIGIALLHPATAKREALARMAQNHLEMETID